MGKNGSKGKEPLSDATRDVGTDATDGNGSKGFDHQTPGGEGGGKGSKGGAPLQDAGAVTCVALRGEVLSISLSLVLFLVLSLSLSLFFLSHSLLHITQPSVSSLLLSSLTLSDTQVYEP